MIQVLGIRTYQKYGRIEPFVTLEKNNWIFESIEHLFANYVEFIASVPEEERYNLMFTISHVEKGTTRTFESQDIYPFDIDGIDTQRAEEYLDAVLPVLGVTRKECIAVMTGNGIHIYIQGKEFTNVDFFKEKRQHYKLLTDKCNKALADNWLIGTLDTDMWSPARMGRLPDVINRKDYKGKPDVMTRLLCNNIKPTGFDLDKKIELVAVPTNEQINPNALTRLPKVDTKGVIDGCSFLQYCRDNQDKVVEPQWYAMLSIVSRLDGGREMCHAFSMRHPHYNEANTELKIEQSLLSSGPRTCENISAMWSGCTSCEHNGKVKSPILIKGEDYLETEATGFRFIAVTKEGLSVPKGINYDDLLKYYNRLHPHITIAETGEVYTYIDTHWRVTTRLDLQAFCEDNVLPKPKGAEREEFVKKVLANNLKPKEFLDCTGFMNLKNGIFDLSTKVLIPHSPEFGFRTLIPYDYDEAATCPTFDKFLASVTCGDADLQRVLMEYAGYCMSNTPPEYGEKALILLGEGANGKSVFIDVMRTLAGDGSTSSITMADLGNETHRYQLVGKMFNVAEETPRKSMMESSSFKNLITGGTMTVKQLYHQPYSCKCTCKFIFAGNDLPSTPDLSHGLFRRLIIAPFNASFTGAKANKNIRNEIISELSGVLNRVIEGYDRLKAQRWHFSTAEAIEDEIEEFASSISPTEEWFSDNMRVEASMTGGHRMVDIYKAYRADIENSYGSKAVLDPITFRAQVRRYVRKHTADPWNVRMNRGTGKLRGVIVTGLASESDDETDEAKSF